MNKMRAAMQNMHAIQAEVLQLWSNPPKSRKERLSLLHLSFEKLGIPQSQWPTSVGKAKELGDMEILSIVNIWYISDVNLLEITYQCRVPYGSNHETVRQKKRYSIGDAILVIPVIKTSDGFKTALRQTHRAADGLQTDFPRGFVALNEEGKFASYGDGKEIVLTKEEAAKEILNKNAPGLLKHTTNGQVYQVAIPGKEDNSATPQNIWVFIYFCEGLEQLEDEKGLRKVLRETHPNSPVKSTKILSLQRMDAIFSSYVSGMGRTPFKSGWLNNDHDKAARFMASDWLENLANYVKPSWDVLQELIS